LTTQCTDTEGGRYPNWSFHIVRKVIPRPELFPKIPRTADNGWFSSLVIERGANNNCSLKRLTRYEMLRRSSEPDRFFGTTLGTEKSVH